MRLSPTGARQILSGQFEAGLTLPVTYHVVIAFDRDAEGNLKPSEAREVISPIVAERRARALALEHAGALHVRTGDPATGEFQDAVILARFGEVDLEFARRVKGGAIRTPLAGRKEPCSILRFSWVR